MRAAVIALGAVAAFASACGGRPPPPKRLVIESNVASWTFRRYQRLVDVEVWVPDNRAVGHTASYAAAAAVKRGRLADDDVVHAFVTRYAKPDGVLRATVAFARRLAQEAGYQVEERTIEGVRLYAVAGQGEAWVLWCSGRYIVKLGGRGRSSVPGALVEAYGERYPSSLPAGALEGPLPEGPSLQPPDASEPYDPNNPRPDWDHDKRRRGDR
ncbi:MAG: hypothetical protein D6689_13460 [Deltaproteobacteria bacterium]|nr:MAG: hypothetical protein D6689_13460 [Deltaproteobacteria bacterium]